LEKKYSYEFGFSFPGRTRALGSGLIVAALGSSLYSIWGILLAAIGYLYFWSREGIEVDLEKNRYREFENYFLFKTGEWITVLPDYISVFRARMKQNNESTSSLQAFEFSEYQVNLIDKRKKRIILYTTESKLLAFNLAENLSDNFTLPVYDASETEHKWHKKIK
jgi:hypothetical protein